MDAVKLEWHARLLGYRQDLNPSETLSCVDYLGYALPFSLGKRLFKIDFETLKLG